MLEKLADFLSPTAQADIGPIPNPSTALEQLITEGRNAFFNGTFNGNGRTCGSCHREENNLTIDPEFIATLPPTIRCSSRNSIPRSLRISRTRS